MKSDCIIQKDKGAFSCRKYSMSNYYEWDIFENIYLEDGFVLGIEES